VPDFDREGGSRRIFHFIQFFIQAGWTVTVAAVDGAGSERYARTLQQMGVPTYALTGAWSADRSELVDFDQLVANGAFDVVLFGFWHCAEPYIPRVRALSPSSTIMVDSIDLHFLRQSRQVFSAESANGRLLDRTYGDEMRREINAYAGADAVLTVSHKESQIVDDMTGRRHAYTIPDMEEAEASAAPFRDRRGMLFVGNFRHPPNVQAVEYLCNKVVPRIPEAVLSENPIYIVGTDPTDSVIEACGRWAQVRLVGWVPSVLPYLQHVRISVIPLLYGAGTKRKLMQSLMVGTPSVSTTIGIEGLGLKHQLHVLVADDPEAFADSIVRLLEDAELWQRLADRGRDFICKTHGRDAAFARWNSVLARVLRKDCAPAD
jgi:glycosyltransferase involved in cell wall biosynthesis